MKRIKNNESGTNNQSTRIGLIFLFFFFFVSWLYDDIFGHFLSYYFRSVSITTMTFPQKKRDKKVNEKVGGVFVGWRIIKETKKKKKRIHM